MDLDLRSKSIEKLVDVCASGLGAVSAAWLTKRNAKAEAEALLITARAQADVHELLADSTTPDSSEIESKVNIEIADGKSAIQHRLEYQEVKRQQNLANITRVAAEKIGDEVSSEKVDEDWIARFFNYAQDISNEQVQELWGKILAGEVANPSSFSLRTLDTLRNMTRLEAETISRIKPLVFGQNDQIYRTQNTESTHFIDMRKQIHLQELGIIQDSGLGITSEFKSTVKGEYYTHFIIGKTVLFLRDPDETKSFATKIFALTTAGAQLLSLIDLQGDEEIIEEVIASAKNQGFAVTKSEVLEILPDGLRHSEIVDA